jgi:hypothetical protein
MNNESYELPDDDAVADARLYARLQSEMEARMRAADVVPLSSLTASTPQPKPRLVDGRWVWT